MEELQICYLKPTNKEGVFWGPREQIPAQKWVVSESPFDSEKTG
jgi:hypothetical protein